MAVDRLVLLRDLYGFAFPEDLAESFAVIKRLRPLEPLLALQDALDLHLVGPFEVLAGRFDQAAVQPLMVLHWRFANDPPELFTAMVRAEDDLHWGYWLHTLSPHSPEGIPSLAMADPEDPGGITLWKRGFLGGVRVLIEEKQAILDDADEAGLGLPQDAQSRETLARLRDRLGYFTRGVSPWDDPRTGLDFLEALGNQGRKRTHPPSPEGWTLPQDFAVALSQLDAAIADANLNLAAHLKGRLWKRATWKRMPQILQRLVHYYQGANQPILAKVCELSIEHFGRDWLDVADAGQSRSEL